MLNILLALDAAYNITKDKLFNKDEDDDDIYKLFKRNEHHRNTPYKVEDPWCELIYEDGSWRELSNEEGSWYELL